MFAQLFAPPWRSAHAREGGRAGDFSRLGCFDDANRATAGLLRRGEEEAAARNVDEACL